MDRAQLSSRPARHRRAPSYLNDETFQLYDYRPPQIGSSSTGSSFEGQIRPQNHGIDLSSCISNRSSPTPSIMSSDAFASQKMTKKPTSRPKQPNGRRALIDAKDITRRRSTMATKVLTETDNDASILPSTEQTVLEKPAIAKKPRKPYVRKVKAKVSEPSPRLPDYLAAAYGKALRDLGELNHARWARTRTRKVSNPVCSPSA